MHNMLPGSSVLEPVMAAMDVTHLACMRHALLANRMLLSDFSVVLVCIGAAEWQLVGNPLWHVHTRGLLIWTVLLAALVLSLVWSLVTGFHLAWTIGAGSYLATVTARAVATSRPGYASTTQRLSEPVTPAHICRPWVLVLWVRSIACCKAHKT